MSRTPCQNLDGTPKRAYRSRRTALRKARQTFHDRRNEGPVAVYLCPMCGLSDIARVLRLAPRCAAIPGCSSGVLLGDVLVVADVDSDPTGKHRDCDYYVLDLRHDKHAAAALRAYAMSCDGECPALASDLRDIAGEIEDRAVLTLAPSQSEAPVYRHIEKDRDADHSAVPLNGGFEVTVCAECRSRGLRLTAVYWDHDAVANPTEPATRNATEPVTRDSFLANLFRYTAPSLAWEGSSDQLRAYIHSDLDALLAAAAEAQSGRLVEALRSIRLVLRSVIDTPAPTVAIDRHALDGAIADIDAALANPVATDSDDR